MARGPKDHLRARIAYVLESDWTILFDEVTIEDPVGELRTWDNDRITNTWTDLTP